MTQEQTPFLSSLAKRGMRGIIAPQFSFSLHPAWFAGLYPDESGIWGYYYSPRTSPYRFLKPVSLLAPRNQTVSRLYHSAMWKALRWCGTLASYLPLRYTHYFDFSDKLPPWAPEYLPQVGIFDILRAQRLEWLFIGAPGTFLGTQNVLTKLKRKISHGISFVWLHFAELDWTCHEFGPDSDQAKRCLGEIDSAIRRVSEELNDLYEDVELLVFGDHGSVEVERTVDIEAILNSTEFEPPGDFVYFLGATTARFWFQNATARYTIEAALRQLESGKILSESRLEACRCKFDDSRYGELMWTAVEGTVISPNFYNGSSIPKGMHGYLPDVKDTFAAFVLSGPSTENSITLSDPIQMVDIFPTLLDLMGLPAPQDRQATSVLSRR